jgi:hypothetical protein
MGFVRVRIHADHLSKPHGLHPSVCPYASSFDKLRHLVWSLDGGSVHVTVYTYVGVGLEGEILV